CSGSGRWSSVLAVSSGVSAPDSGESPLGAVAESGDAAAPGAPEVGAPGGGAPGRCPGITTGVSMVGADRAVAAPAAGPEGGRTVSVVPRLGGGAPGLAAAGEVGAGELGATGDPGAGAGPAAGDCGRLAIGGGLTGSGVGMELF